MMKIESATALARSDGATTFTIAEFTGPVDANTKTSEMMIAVRYTGFDALVNAMSAIGAAASIDTPQTQRYACFVNFNRESAIHPPAAVPTDPVTSTIVPNVTVASARGRPRTRWRKAGAHTPRPPMANVHAA